MHACSGLGSSEELADFHISDLLCVTKEMFINNESTVSFVSELTGALEADGRGVWL